MNTFCGAQNTNHVVFTIVHELDVSHGHTYNIMSPLQRTALFLACARGHLVAAKVLIHNGADVTTQVQDNSTGAVLNCLDVAVKEGHKYMYMLSSALLSCIIPMISTPLLWLALLCFSDIAMYKIPN